MPTDIKKLLEHAKKKSIVSVLSSNEISEEEKKKLIQHIVDNVRHLSKSSRAILPPEKYRSLLASIIDSLPQYRKYVATLLTKDHIENLLRDRHATESMPTLLLLASILKSPEFSHFHEKIVEWAFYNINNFVVRTLLLKEILKEPKCSHIHTKVLKGTVQNLPFYGARDILEAIFTDPKLSKHRATVSSLLTDKDIEMTVSHAVLFGGWDLLTKILKSPEASDLHKTILKEAVKHNAWRFLVTLLRDPELSMYHSAIADLLEDEHIQALVKSAYHSANHDAHQLITEILKREEFSNAHNKILSEVVKVIDSKGARVFLTEIIRRPEFSHLQEKIIEAFPSAPASRYVVALAHEFAKHHSNRKEELEKIVHGVMRKMYEQKWRKNPPEPRNPEKLPQRTRTYVVEHTIPVKKETAAILPADIVKAAEELGISLRSIYDVYNAIDTLTVHRDQILKRMEQKGMKRKEAEEKIRELLKKLNSLAKKVGTKRAILDFYLRPTPKKALEWVDARIRASSDCTVPSSPYPGFEEHAVPYFFSSNAFNLEIRATHLDTVKIKRKGKVKTRIRVRKDRHVGNIYAALLKHKGKNVLYISGIQLGKIYRGKENTAIAKPILAAIHEVAERIGADEVWFNAADLSNFTPLRDRTLEHIKNLGAKLLRSPVDVEYGDLPRYHYASPSRTTVYTLPAEKLKEI